LPIKEQQSEGTTLDAAQKVILAGENVYDAVVSNIVTQSTLTQSGLLYNLFDVPYIDTEADWWDSNLASSLSIAGYLGYCTGDITVMDNDAVWVLMFNKQMAEDYGHGDLYSRIIAMDWTHDDFKEIMAEVTTDLNGDGKMDPNVDKYGMVTTTNTGYSLLYNYGMKMVGKDSDDIPYLALDEDFVSTIVDEIAATMNDSSLMDYVGGVHVAKVAFPEGRAMFYGEVLQCVQRMRDSTTDFGVIPWPRFNEAQENYNHVAIQSAAKAVSIPKTQPDLEMAGLILEAMAAKSKYTLTPAYYDIALTQKYMRDEESRTMLDLILGTIRYDLAYVYNWNNLHQDIAFAAIYNNGNFASAVAAKRDSFETLMQQTVDTYIEAAKQ